MNKLKSKLKSKKGFTLIEMLIVVAIIAILVAIAIPAVTNSLNKARLATDESNFRNAKSVALVMEMDDTTIESGKYYFNADKGTFEGESSGAPAGSYKAQATDTTDGENKHNKEEYIVVTFSDGSISDDVKWSTS